MREKEAICFCFSASDSSGLNLRPKGSETPHLTAKHIILTFSPQTQEALKEETRRRDRGEQPAGHGFLLPTECRRAPPGIPGPDTLISRCHLPRAQGACPVPSQTGPHIHSSRICHCESRHRGLSCSLPVPIPHASQGCSMMASGLYIPEANLLQLQNFPYML